MFIVKNWKNGRGSNIPEVTAGAVPDSFKDGQLIQ
jgi:hypothetical protein